MTLLDDPTTEDLIQPSRSPRRLGHPASELDEHDAVNAILAGRDPRSVNQGLPQRESLDDTVPTFTFLALEPEIKDALQSGKGRVQFPVLDTYGAILHAIAERNVRNVLVVVQDLAKLDFREIDLIAFGLQEFGGDVVTLQWHGVCNMRTVPAA